MSVKMSFFPYDVKHVDISV